MATMLAAQYSANSQDVSAFEIATVPVPQPTPGNVVVRVAFAGVNPIDHLVMKGYMKAAGWSMPFPFTLGYDFSGVVAAVHDDVTTFAVGDAVYGVNWGIHKHDEGDLSVAGTFAQFALIPAKRLSKKPSSLSFAVAAALPLVGTTALQALGQLNVKAGTKVLILGGAGAVGIVAIQLAKKLGAFVATTVSSRNVDFIKEFGPDQIVNYQTEDWGQLKGFDAVLDAAGEPGGFKKASSGVLQPTGGFLSLVSNEAGYNPAGHPPLTYAALYGLKNHPADQEAVAEAISNGSIKLPIEEVFDFGKEGVLAILKKIEGGKSKGKNILRISQDFN